MFCSVEREEVELINSGVQKLNKDAEPISLGSIQSPGNHFFSCLFVISFNSTQDAVQCIYLFGIHLLQSFIKVSA